MHQALIEKVVISSDDCLQDQKPVLLQRKKLPGVPWKPWPLHFSFLGAIQEVSEFLSVCLIGVCKLAHQQHIKINHSLPGSPALPAHQMVIFHHAGVAQTFFLRSKYDLWFLLVKFGSLESKEILRNGVDLITSCKKKSSHAKFSWLCFRE